SVRERVFHYVRHFLISPGGEESAAQQIIAAVEIRSPDERQPDLIRSRVVTPLGEKHPRLGALNLRRFVAMRARLLSRGNRSIDPLLLAFEVVVVLRTH